MARKPITKGNNELWFNRSVIQDFVFENFEMLYEGACKGGFNIPMDAYAPKRVQINGTRLHMTMGAKYASGHKYNDEVAPTEEQLKETVADIQELIALYEKPVSCSFSVVSMGKGLYIQERPVGI